jgi:hypothetical protein
MADEGSAQIIALLNAPSESLQADAVALGKALRRSTKEQYGLPPQYGFDALANIRQYYRDLRAQIDAVDTAEIAAKLDAIDALDELDRSIGAFERGLSLGLGKKARPKLKRSDKLAEGALKDLRAARKGLST